MEENALIPSELEAVKLQLEEWRADRKSPKSRLPKELW